MLYKKQGYPEESEIVICTVAKIQYNSVFVVLDEYDKQGIINIAEIAPGRIRNIRDFVNEGKKAICKVLRVMPDRNYIELSLRRVTELQKRAKNDFIKQEQKAEKIVEIVAKELKVPMKALYDQIAGKTGYPSLYSCFEDVSNDKFSLDKILEKKISQKLTELVKLKIKPPEVEIGGSLSLVSYASNGVELVKEALHKGEAPGVRIMYLGGGKFKIDVKAGDYKTAEAMLDKSTKGIMGFMEKNEGQASFERAKESKKTAA